MRALLSTTEEFTRPRRPRGGGGPIALTALGGAINRVSARARPSCTGGRGCWRSTSRLAAGHLRIAQQAWLKGTHTSMRRYASGAAYQNYIDPTLKDWRTAYYGAAATG